MRFYPAGVKATVSGKGRVTIPKRLRDRLGIRAGEQLEFIEEAGRLVATKVRRRSPVDQVYGVLGVQYTDALVADMRGPAEMPAEMP
jgi:AbrB family looped-hinge helix DNA binding protein